MPNPKWSDLQIANIDDYPHAAIAALEGSDTWMDWAKELLPELLDLRDPNVQIGIFFDRGNARGILYDVLHAVRTEVKSEEFLGRAFEFAVRCAKSDDPEVYNPALIGFFCKVAWSERSDAVNMECGSDQGRMPLEELASRMTLDMIQNDEALFSMHYGKDGFEKLVAVKTGKGRN